MYVFSSVRRRRRSPPLAANHSGDISKTACWFHTISHTETSWGWGIQVWVVPFRLTDFIIDICASH
jgi:hypothetical protein